MSGIGRRRSTDGGPAPHFGWLLVLRVLALVPPLWFRIVHPRLHAWQARIAAAG